MSIFSGLSEPDLVAHTLAATLGIREASSRPLDDALVEYFRAHRVLLVLDNCEHLINECAKLVERLLRQAETLHVLATSREGLGLPGEIVWRVPSLTLPESSSAQTPDAIANYEAVRLFSDRARAADASFALTDQNARVVTEICCRLDGIPLAIELAAAKLKVLSVDQLHERLKDRFRLLTGGSRTAVASSARSKPRSTGATTCCPNRNGYSSVASRSSPADGHSTRLNTSAPETASTRSRSSSCCRIWWTSHWSTSTPRPALSGAIAASRLFASTGAIVSHAWARRSERAIDISSSTSHLPNGRSRSSSARSRHGG